MADSITRKDLAAAVDRIENKIDKRVDAFEAHFDETMTATRATLAERTGNADVVVGLIPPTAH
jgi:hypothetical protein